MHALGWQHLASLVATGVTAILICACLSSGLTWWHSEEVLGETRAVLISNNYEASDVAISLWDIKLTLQMQALGGNTLMEINTDWDGYCSDAADSAEFGREPTECMMVRVLRALTILTAIATFAVLAATVASIVFSPLLLLLGMALGVVSVFLGVAGIVMGCVTEVDGIWGPGFILLHLVVILSMILVFATLHVATKAMPEPQAEEIARLPRHQRLQQAITMSLEEHRQLEKGLRGSLSRPSTNPRSSQRESNQWALPVPHSYRSTRSSGETQPQKLPALNRVLLWNKEHCDSRHREPIPIELLQAAYKEIDSDKSGFISVEEFVEALRRCGIAATEDAALRVMGEMDNDQTGDISIHEFVHFFRHLEELSKFQAKEGYRARCLSDFCNTCFISHLVAMCVLLLLFVQLEESDDPDRYSIMRALIIVFAVGLCVLFLFVVFIPAAKLRLAPHVAGWQAHLEAWVQPEIKAPQGGLRIAGEGEIKPMGRWVAEEESNVVTPASVPPGALVSARGEFICYDPSAYSVAAANNVQLKTFNPMQIRDIDDVSVDRLQLQSQPNVMSIANSPATSIPLALPYVRSPRSPVSQVSPLPALSN